jgi:hypothetical protein
MKESKEYQNETLFTRCLSKPITQEDYLRDRNARMLENAWMLFEHLDCSDDSRGLVDVCMWFITQEDFDPQALSGNLYEAVRKELEALDAEDFAASGEETFSPYLVDEPKAPSFRYGDEGSL